MFHYRLKLRFYFKSNKIVLIIKHTVMDNDWFDDESDASANTNAEESASETDNVDSETTEDEEEIDLEKLNLGENYTQGRSYSSRSDMLWSSTPSYSLTTKHHSNINLTSGPTRFAANVASVEDAFLCFISEEMLKKILLHSNTSGNSSKTSDDSFEEISLVELKGFIGLLLISGLLGKSRKSIKSLWNRSPLESPVFRATMSRNRFETIVSCLRFDDKLTREERKNIDKFAAIREIWSDFQNNLKKYYSVGSFVTIDEQLIGFRGKCPFRQFIPTKPDKYGIKLWLCVDANSYYVFDAVPYTGRPPGQDRQRNIGANIVLQLTKPLFGSGRNVTMDNFFTSIPLAKELGTENITLIGTLRKNKPEIPVEFLSNKNRPVGSTMFAFNDNLTLVSYVPKINKAVLLLSSKHHDLKVDTENGKPHIILDYNKTKGAVDTVDQMCHKYSVRRGTRRWPLCVFYNMLDIAALNALVIWKEKNPDWNKNKRFKRRLFLEELGTCLISHLLEVRSQTSKFLHKDVQNAIAVMGYPRMEKALEELNEASTDSKRKRCSFCDRSKDRKTLNKCYKCSEPVCNEHSVKQLFCNTCSK
jgi:hypothetical protein